MHINPPPGLLDIGRRRMLLDYLRPILQVTLHAESIEQA